MIKAIREAFDDFVIAARIKPAITAGIPLLLMVFFNGVVKCKWYALSIYAILAIREILMVDKFGIADIFRNPVPKYTMLLVLVVWSILFCSIVSQKTVKRNAFDYAKMLLETVDVMSGDLEA